MKRPDLNFRLVALLLASCFLAEPARALSFENLKNVCIDKTAVGKILFTSQALAARELNGDSVIVGSPASKVESIKIQSIRPVMPPLNPGVIRFLIANRYQSVLMSLAALSKSWTLPNVLPTELEERLTALVLEGKVTIECVAQVLMDLAYRTVSLEDFYKTAFEAYQIPETIFPGINWPPSDLQETEVFITTLPANVRSIVAVIQEQLRTSKYTYPIFLVGSSLIGRENADIDILTSVEPLQTYFDDAILLRRALQDCFHAQGFEKERLKHVLTCTYFGVPYIRSSIQRYGSAFRITPDKIYELRNTAREPLEIYRLDRSKLRNPQGNWLRAIASLEEHILLAGRFSESHLLNLFYRLNKISGRATAERPANLKRDLDFLAQNPEGKLWKEVVLLANMPLTTPNRTARVMDELYKMIVLYRIFQPLWEEFYWDQSDAAWRAEGHHRVAFLTVNYSMIKNWLSAFYISDERYKRLKDDLEKRRHRSKIIPVLIWEILAPRNSFKLREEDQAS